MEALGTRREPVGPTGAAPAAKGRGKGRWSARRKITVVLELLRGAELEATSRKYGVTAATLARWREAFLEGGESELKIRATDVVDEERKTLKSAVAKLVVEVTRLSGTHSSAEDCRDFPSSFVLIRSTQGQGAAPVFTKVTESS